MLFSLTYVSRATRPMSARDLGALGQQSARANAAHGLSGVLFYVAGQFLQRLEGPQDAVLALMARIRKDPRHASMVVIEAKDVAERVFEGWGMAVVDGRTLVAAPDVNALLAQVLPADLRLAPGRADEVAHALRQLLDLMPPD